jgi:hypothetical protein
VSGEGGRRGARKRKQVGQHPVPNALQTTRAMFLLPISN